MRQGNIYLNIYEWIQWNKQRASLFSWPNNEQRLSVHTANFIIITMLSIDIFLNENGSAHNQQPSIKQN